MCTIDAATLARNAEGFQGFRIQGERMFKKEKKEQKNKKRKRKKNSNNSNNKQQSQPETDTRSPLRPQAVTATTTDD